MTGNGRTWKTGIALGMALVLCGVILAGSASASFLVPQTPLPGKNVPKYVDPVPTFAGNRVPATAPYTATYVEFQQKALPASIYSALQGQYTSGTYVWSYRMTDNAGKVYGPWWPGYTVEAQRGTQVTVKYENDLVNTVLQPDTAGGKPYLTVDQTIHWADPLRLFCTMMAVTCTPGSTDPCCQPFTGPVPVVTHLHGAEVKSDFDGGPDQWFTPDGLQGGAYRSYGPAGTPPTNGAYYHYYNGQEATTLWFHDHALGRTRINVFSGIAAFYLIRDERDTGQPGNDIGLPAGPQEAELMIQDRQFDTNGQILFPDGYPAGLNGPPPNPTIHPFWNPEFFGDVMVVNGKSWPYMNVEPRRYRLRFLNASNARFINLAFSNAIKYGGAGPTIWQIGTDGGFLDAPAPIAFPNRLLLAPAERADVIVDFSRFAGQNLILTNDAKAPFPSGAPADPQTTAQVMQFRVGTTVTGGNDDTCNPALNGCTLRAEPIVRLVDPAKGTLADGVTLARKRQLVLREIEGPGGPIEVLLNNTKWSGLKESTMTSTSPVKVDPDAFFRYTVPKPDGMGGDAGKVWMTEGPEIGSTEEWELINTTGDAHPIHIHLIQFQVMNRQPYQANKYLSAWLTALTAAGKGPGDGPPYLYDNSDNPTMPAGSNIVGGNLLVDPYLIQSPVPPSANEAGWKDTVVAPPGTVTRLVARWTPQHNAIGDTTPYTLFDATDGPGFVWHCHILDHEDNEMMRPYIPVNP